MLGTLAVVGIGALVFKLGMDAARKSDSGKSAGQIASELPKDAVDTVCSTGKDVYDTVSSWLPCGCGGGGGYHPQEDDDTGDDVVKGEEPQKT